MGDLSASVRLKLERANEHADSLESLIDEWQETDPVTFVADDYDDGDTEHHKMRYLVRVSNPLPADELSKVFGDCINNYRCVLDHLIWELSVVNAGGAPSNPTAVKFPAKPSGKVPAGLHAVDPAVVTEVKWLHANCAAQDPGDPSPFWMLIQLSNIDKHRTVHIINHFAAGPDIKTDPVIIGTRIDPFDVPELKDGAVLAEIVMPRPLWERETVKVYTKTRHGVVIPKTTRTPVAHLGMTVVGIKEAVETAAERLRQHLP